MRGWFESRGRCSDSKPVFHRLRPRRVSSGGTGLPVMALPQSRRSGWIARDRSPLMRGRVHQCRVQRSTNTYGKTCTMRRGCSGFRLNLETAKEGISTIPCCLQTISRRIGRGDSVHPDPSRFVGRPVVVTEKFDGSNVLIPIRVGVDSSTDRGLLALPGGDFLERHGALLIARFWHNLRFLVAGPPCRHG